MNLEIIRATFGNNNSFQDITEKVKTLLSTKYFVFVGNNLGDPVIGQKKKFKISYRLDGKVTFVELDEGQIFLHPAMEYGIPEGTQENREKFSILSAEFGCNNIWIDVKDKVAAKVKDPYHPVVFASVDLGDPCFGIQKSLVITFRYKGIRYVTCMQEFEWRSLLSLESSTSIFIDEISPIFAPILKLKKDLAVADVQNAVMQSGLSNYSLYNYPKDLHPYCGKGLNIWQYPIQFAPYLCKVLEEVKPKNYVEIGTRFGGTFAFTVEFFKRFSGLEKAYGIDLLPSAFLNAYQRYNQDVNIIVGDSQQAAVKSSLEVKAPYDLIFIDGDHRYAGCMADIEFAAKNSKAFAVHDICDTGFGGNDVPKAWAEFKQKATGWKVYEYTAQYEQFNNSLKTYLGIGLAIKS